MRVADHPNRVAKISVSTFVKVFLYIKMFLEIFELASIPLRNHLYDFGLVFISSLIWD
jgi:hypothetical protein